MKLRSLWYPFRLLKERYFGAAARNPLAAKHRLAKLSPQLPAEVSAAAGKAVADLIDYQDSDYALLYLDRIGRYAFPGSIPPPLLAGTARHLADLMMFDDPISAARLRQTNMIGPDTEVSYCVDEIIEMFPAAFASYVIVISDKMKWSDKQVRMRLGTASPLSRWLTGLLSNGRAMRNYSLRFKKQRALIERWLHMIDRSYSKQPAMLSDVIDSASLIRGHGRTHHLGLANWTRIIDHLVKPACDGDRHDDNLAAMVTEARMEAMADPSGLRLRRLLSSQIVHARAMTSAPHR